MGNTSLFILQINIYIFERSFTMDANAAKGLENLSPQQKEELMRTVQTQVALANMQELLTKITDKCFKKCISSPGSSLTSSDQKCLAMCMDRYMDSFNLVSKTYTNKLRQES